MHLSSYRVFSRYSIPVVMDGRDLMACAQTGSGKTAAFLLPILHRLLEEGPVYDSGSHEQCPQALIVAPTRELAVQINREALKFSHGSGLRSLVVYGGTSVFHQREQIRQGVNVLVSTPGRLLQFLEEGVINLRKVLV